MLVAESAGGALFLEQLAVEADYPHRIVAYSFAPFDITDDQSPEA
jgi:hypothetical protein